MESKNSAACKIPFQQTPIKSKLKEEEVAVAVEATATSEQ